MPWCRHDGSLCKFEEVCFLLGSSLIITSITSLISDARCTPVMLFDFLLQIKADPTSHDVQKTDTTGHTGRS